MTVNAGQGAQLYVKLEAGRLVQEDSVEAKLGATSRTVALVIRSKTRSKFCMFTGDFDGEETTEDVKLLRVSPSDVLQDASDQGGDAGPLFGIKKGHISEVDDGAVNNMDCTSGDSGTAFVLPHVGVYGGLMGRAQYTGITFEASQVHDDELEVCSVAFGAHDGTKGTRVRCTTIEVLVIPVIASEVVRFATMVVDDDLNKELTDIDTAGGDTELMRSLYYQEKWTGQNISSHYRQENVYGMGRRRVIHYVYKLGKPSSSATMV